MVKARVVGAAVLVATLFSLAAPLPASADYSDVPPDHWAAAAVAYVANDRDWMASADGLFRPDARLTRREFARAMARAFAQGEQPDPALTFSDLPPEDPDYAAVNVVVKHAWLVAASGSFAPEGPVSKRAMARALVFALSLHAEVAGLNAIATSDGQKVAHRGDFAYLVLAEQLRLHRNYPKTDETPELLPGYAVRRADAAHALRRAATLVGSAELQLLQRYRSVVLPVLSPAHRQAVEFAFAWVGYPYVYAGEWFRKTPSRYCCGAQPVGGFDCSGFVWWVIRGPVGGWDNTSVRSYAGWPLPERSSREMAKGATERLAYEAALPLDLLFFDSDSSDADGVDWQSVDHVGLSLGNGWMIHSSGGRAGATIDWAADGWWREHFRWARRVAV